MAEPANRDESSKLFAEIRQTERAIDAQSTPLTDPTREAARLESLASLNEQLYRDRVRVRTLTEKIAALDSTTPDRVSILRAIDDLETLWGHMTLSERDWLMSLLIERIDHDPTGNCISITLSPAGLDCLGTSTSNGN